MGIKTKTIHECTCDKCHDVVEDYFKPTEYVVGGDGRDVQITAKIDLEYVIPYSPQPNILCNPCAKEVIQNILNRM